MTVEEPYDDFIGDTIALYFSEEGAKMADRYYHVRECGLPSWVTTLSLCF